MKTLLMKRPSIPALLLACALAVVAGATTAAETPIETSAECVAKITADYDTKIAKAQAEGREKVVAFYGRKKAEFIEGCKVNDQIIEKDKQISENRKEISENEKKIAELTSLIAEADYRNKIYATLFPTLKRVNAKLKATPEEMSILKEGLNAINSSPTLPNKEKYAKVLGDLIRALEALEASHQYQR